MERSFDQAASGEAEEDIFERAAPDQCAFRLNPAAVQRGRRRLTVVGIEQAPVGEHFDTVRQALELAIERGRRVDRGTKLEHLASGGLREQSSGRPARDAL